MCFNFLQVVVYSCEQIVWQSWNVIMCFAVSDGQDIVFCW